MSIDPTNQIPAAQWQFVPPECLPEPIDYESLITEDDKPVDSWYAERQHRLLTDVLHASWQTPGGRPHLAATDVALFYIAQNPAFSPDVMVSLDVEAPKADNNEKWNRSYFVWTFGKPPDGIVEVVSNTGGGELTTKLAGYARIGVAYYVVWDPYCYLGKQRLHCFRLDIDKRAYMECDPWFPGLELGVKTWDGEYDGMSRQWLRWCDRQGNLLATGVERAQAAEHLASEAAQRADNAEHLASEAAQRAAKLAEKLRALGIDPDA